MRTDLQRGIGVSAPGRLHLGFLDPAGSLGRSFGSLGLVIDGFETRLALRAASADRLSAQTPDAEAELARVSSILRMLRERSGRFEPLQIDLLTALPAHAGFGSGTQLALAVGRAFARWHDLAVDTPTLARWLGRGVRSGVGIAGFDAGGLLLDGGPGPDGRPAPLLSRLPLPAAWRVVVVQDTRHRGLSGAAEKQAIAELPALSRANAADICHQVLMQVLPGAADDDFTAFARGVTRIQQVLGGHFAPAQGGSAHTSAAVGGLLRWLADAAGAAGGAAVGQSSWGPTGFAILPSQRQAAALVDAARSSGVVDAALSVRIVAGRNHGATVSETFEAPAVPASPTEPSARPLHHAR